MLFKYGLFVLSLLLGLGVVSYAIGWFSANLKVRGRSILSMRLTGLGILISGLCGGAHVVVIANNSRGAAYESFWFHMLVLAVSVLVFGRLGAVGQRFGEQAFKSSVSGQSIQKEQN